jgi:molybdate transport system permease protein
MDAADLQALGLSLRLAAVTVTCLLAVSIPLGWWLARSDRPWKPLVEAFVALPLVLPPTVLGFYLLVLFGPHGPLGWLSRQLGTAGLAFSFEGLIIGSILYSLPFVVQPVRSAFQAIDPRLLEAAATLGATPRDRFLTVVLPNARVGLIAGAVLGFAHTLGEFGVVLMIGGNLAGTTRVASVALYNQIEAMNYGRAHRLAAALLILCFVMLAPMYWLERRKAQRR